MSKNEINEDNKRGRDGARKMERVGERQYQQRTRTQKKKSVVVTVFSNP